MLSTKKLTMRRKEMKNSSIQGLLFLIGCRDRERKWKKRGGEVAWGQKGKKRTHQRVRKEGEEGWRGRRGESINKKTI